MKAKRQARRVGALGTALLLILSLCTACGPSRSTAADLSQLRKGEVVYNALREEGTLQPSSEELEGLTSVQQNEWLMLYYRESSAGISVFDKRTGGWWHSNPENATSPASQSQLNIATISSKGVTKQYTSYTDSLLRGQVSFTIQNGLTVTYTFGNPKTDLSLVPQQLTAARYEELSARIKAAGGNESLLKRRYNYKDGIWELKETLTNDQAEKLRELFELIEYTEEELSQDNAGSSAQMESDSFTIPLTYTLEGDSLRVYVNGEQVVYPKNEIITSLDILEYFGALTRNEEGYLFIPDGSGALVDTKEHAGTAYANLPLYGRDNTLPQKTAYTTGNDCLLPVFGIHRPDGGILTIIEDNEAVASVQVVKPGQVDDFTTVSAAFELNAVQNIGLSSDSISKFYITADTRYPGNTSLRYVFLNESDADYVGMAGVYRDYLDHVGQRVPIEVQTALPFLLETVGAIKTEVSTLGFVHDTLVPLTTYRDNIMLLEKLRDRGVDNISLVLNGWMNGGVDAGFTDAIRLIKELGGQQGFDTLLNWAEEHQVHVYPEVLLNTFSADESLSVKNTYASCSLDSKKSYISLYEPVTGSPLANGKRYLLSPAWQSNISMSLQKSLKKLGCNSINLGDISTTVYSDYHADSEVLRQMARLQSGQIVRGFSQTFSDVMLTAPNDLTAVYSRLYTDVPKSSSGLTLAMCSVPFYQMVYHGYAQYSFTAMNYDVDLTQSMLKCAEYGGLPKFQFIAREGEQVSFLDSADYYASYYENWLDSASEVYTFLDTLLTPVAHARMIGHICLAQGVYRTDYDNGMSIYVNYTTEPVTVNDITVGAQTAIRKEGVQ